MTDCVHGHEGEIERLQGIIEGRYPDSGWAKVFQLEAELVRLKSAEFWSNWVYPEGAKAEDVQNELADFKDLIDRFGKVLDHATGGRMSKANYTVEAMCSEIDAHYEDE